ncbi:MAG: chitobiase/beta-hexosaminidase C-terminal domain-containing protein [Paludibacter sp.]|nr:chitobiase/beta-hexosaminidase C-terminal domain-containing protein [Paludibacter sp.]
MKITSFTKIILITFALFSFTFLSAQSRKVLITEFMAVNSNGIVDEDNEHSDWLEIYNNTNSAIDLTGWYLTDNPNTLKEWQFPSVTIPKAGYMVIFASGKDRIDPTGNLHTNFKLSGSGEFLAICEPDSTISFSYSPMFPAQRQDVSFGYFQGQEVFFTTSTPGAENVAGSLPFAPNFSATRGFYKTAFDVTLSLPGGDGSIYYTTNGTRPTKSNGTLYSAPIHVSTTTPLSAITINSANLYSEIITNTYVFLADVVKQPSEPAGYPTDWKQYKSTTTIPTDYEMDPAICNSSTYKSQMESALTAIPTMHIVTDIENLFSDVEDENTGGIYIYTGKPSGVGVDWVRPTSVEYFDPITGKEFQINCELKLHGGNSRNPGNCPKHGFEIGFKSSYGPSKLNFNLFDEKKVTNEFNGLVLRGGYNYTWVKNSATQQVSAQYIQDSWAKTTQLDMGQTSAHERFVHLYLNGLYWGLYNITEEYDDDFMESYFSGDKSEFDVIKEQQSTTPTAGNMTAWKDLLSQVQTTSLSDNTKYQKLQGRNTDGSVNSAYLNLLDVDNYIDYLLINYYLGNQDWDKNNWTVGRNRVKNDAGFKFFCWDGETTMTDVNLDIVKAGGTDGNPAAFIKYLKKNNDFLVLMADHIQKSMIDAGGMLTPTVIEERYNNLADEIDLPIIGESARWGDWYNNTGPYTRNDHWIPRKNDLLTNYFPVRTQNVVTQLQDAGLFPSVDAPKYSHDGGQLSSAINLGITSNKGTIYYTIDGSDPRIAISNVVATTAKTYSSQFSIGSDVTIKARSKTSTEWSAISEVSFSFASAVNLPFAEMLVCKGYPNPFSESTHIQLTLPYNGNIQLDVYSIDGRLIEQIYRGTAENGTQQYEWSPKTSEKGIFICRILFEGQSTYLKLIRQ